MPNDDGLTEQQRKWMASVRASLESSTGRSLAQWVEIARTCPETKPKAWQKWMKEVHGLGQNYAMMVKHEMGRLDGAQPRDPKALAAGLWSEPRAAATFKKLQAAADALPGAVTGQRKTYTTWSKTYAFACARPVGKAGEVRLGLALEPAADKRLQPAAKEGWSERLKSTVVLGSAAEVDAGLKALIEAAFANG